MSYLVDALRKAERERNFGKMPDIAAANYDYEAEPERDLSRWILFAVAALVLLNIVALSALWLWRSLPAPAEQAAPASITQQTGQAASQLNQSETSPAAPATAQPASQAGLSEPETADSFSGPDYESELADAEVPHLQALPNHQRDALPNMSVNGHLYSSIPGRSFILINGRRYREGQRIAEGPAIETIDETGAVLKYRDFRFRLDAPR